MASQLRITGFAIVSADGMIADAAGTMPAGIVNAADQRYFSDGLDSADIVVHGRNSHEHHSHSAQRRRIVLSRGIEAIKPHAVYPLAVWWNPAGATLEEACARLGVREGTVAVIGGTDVFGRFLPDYSSFHLSCAENTLLGSGRPVFPGIPPHTPGELLTQHGLSLVLRQDLDAEAGVSLQVWERVS